MSQFSALRNKLVEYSELSYNWDGYGGVTPPENIINQATDIINLMELITITLPRIMVSGSGSISFFWKMNGIILKLV